MNYVIWDIETDSAQLDWATMIEIGAILLDENFKESCALVMGSEESGIRTKTSENCNSLIGLSVNKNFKSFNVSVATGIILSEVLRQRRY